MTLEEKRKAIEKHCGTQEEGCDLCPLDKIARDRVGCFNDNVPEEQINEHYSILFGNEESAPEYPEDSVEPATDPVNRPAHYTDGKIEVIDYIEDKKLGFCLGNAIKYISRAGKKDPSKEIEDLKKAKWYIERRIKELEEARV